MANIMVWKDDPESALGLIQVPQPDLAKGPYALRMNGDAPEAKPYDRGTNEFRYWSCAAAASRGAAFWASLVPAGTTWQPGKILPIILDGGEDLNAYYDRNALNFFHGRGADGSTVYSGESPDIVCHELGHGILDSLRPELFDTASLEVPAFHEAFADISALLTALQVPEVRDAILSETGGHIDHNSNWSRLAEQLGSAIRAVSPGAVDTDCLRNAANSFHYQDPEGLDADSPASTLSQEPHNFSRVFSGAFLEAFAGMVLTHSSRPTGADLQALSEKAGSLLVAAVQTAPIVPEWYSQVAAALIEADRKTGGTYNVALTSAFVRRGLLSTQSALATGMLQAGAAGIAAAAPQAKVTEMPLQAINGMPYGLGQVPLFVHVANQARRIAAIAAGRGGLQVIPPSSDRAARSFVDHLLRLGRIDFGAHGVVGGFVAHPRSRKTHRIARLATGELALKRILFDCGFCGL
ncbi:MAG TPA: hypothetical protein VMT61_04610 [Candidatus Binataceae bacterium]|nr:hypothetical protein [Candidatus Binataceae bacterium]